MSSPNKVEKPTQLFIRKEEGTKEAFFSHLYDTQKFRRWFNTIPIVWVKFDRPQFDEGCTGRLYFAMPPFFYQMTCKKVIPNERIEAEVSGLLKGTITAILSDRPDGALLDHPLVVTGKNRWTHFYYSLFLAPNHVAFMNWRYQVLRKNLIKEKTKKIQVNPINPVNPVKK